MTAIDCSVAPVPVPVRFTLIGLLNALKAIVSTPVCVPVPNGLNCTPIVQVPPAPTAEHVLLLTAKLPVIVGADTVSVVLSAFVKVIVLAALVVPDAWLENVKIVGETVTGTEPVPFKVTVCGLLSALSVNVSEPLRAPVALGVNVTPTEQAAPAAMLVPQVLLAML